MTPIRAAELARLCQTLLGEGSLEGDGGLLITGINSLDAAGPAEMSFVATQKAAALAANSSAGLLLVTASFEASGGRTLIRISDPRAAVARLIAALYAKPAPEPGLHPSAVVDPSVQIGSGVHIAPHVTIGAGSRLGDGCVIGSGCAIGENVSLGAHCLIYPNVTVYDRVRIGERVIIHSGAVLGADGFGFAFVGGHYQKFPQIGDVEIGDDVEIGANTCIDRAALGVTRIGRGAKLDNQVHVAHNCQIGDHVVVAAQTGFSGGVVIGDYAVIGGQVGVGDKARIESKAVVGSGAGILTSKIVRAGQPVWGTPARPLREHLEQLAALAKLPEMRAELRDLSKRLARCEEKAEL
jgi:UDP-3-O-[3-hydroxymyristoyl] glucosamine N-acyltransferase